MEILVASGNAKKRAELVELLAGRGVRVLGPADVGGLPEVIEDGETFAHNARKKASAGARHTGRWCLADDSGLVVEALDGAPGVRSARFAGPRADDAANRARLLGLMAGVPPDQRGAHFTCVLALADPSGRIELEIEGRASGSILESERGTGGFGYDSLFLFNEDAPGCGRSFAQLSAAEKAAVSHRGRAMAELARRLPEVLAQTPGRDGEPR